MDRRICSLTLASAVLVLTSCNEHLEKLAVTAPTTGAVATLINGSGITVKEAKIRVINGAGYEEPWRAIPNLSKGDSVPIDLMPAIENTHHPNVPPGITITVQMSQAHQAPQLKSWDFTEDSSTGAGIRLVPYSAPVEKVPH